MDAKDGSFRRVRQLLLQDPSPRDYVLRKPANEKQKQRKHPWDTVNERRKRPVERCRLKPSFAASIREEEDDEDLEALSSSHRNQAYDLRSNDPRSERVYRWNDVDNDEYYDGLQFPSTVKDKLSRGSSSSGAKGLNSWKSRMKYSKSSRYLNRRPNKIETKSLFPTILEEPDATTPMTVPMDDEEFEGIESSFCSLISCTSANSNKEEDTRVVVREPAWRDANHPMDDDDASEGTEVTLDMFSEEKAMSEEKLISMEEKAVLQNVRGKIEEHLDKRAEVRRLVEEHERLMQQAHGNSFALKTKTPAKNDHVLGDENFTRETKPTTMSPKNERALYDSDTGLVVVKEAKQRKNRYWGKGRLNQETKASMTPVNENALFDSDTGLLILEENQAGEKETISNGNLNEWLGGWGEVTGAPVEAGQSRIEESIQNELETNPCLKNLAGNTHFTNHSFQQTKNSEVEERRNSPSIDVTHSGCEQKSFLVQGSVHSDLSTGIENQTAFQRARKAFESSSFPGASITPGNFRQMKVEKLSKVTIAAGLIDAQTSGTDQEIKPGNTIRVVNKILAMETRLTHASQRQINDVFFSEARIVERRGRAATSIQSLYRRGVASQEASIRRLEVKKIHSATLIQATWRGYDSRMDFVWHRASVLVQAQFRSIICRRRYQEILSSVVLLQSIARMQISRAQHMARRSSASIIQATWRSFLCRTQLRNFRSSAVRIQSFARRHIHRARFLRLKVSAISIQAASRRFNDRRKFLEQGQMRSSASITIQSAVRTKLSKRRFLQALKEIHATTRIQSIIRMNSCRTEYLQKQQATTVVQSVIRMQSCRMQYLQRKEAVVILQAVSRMYPLRARHVERKRAILSIQSSLRMHLCRADFLAKKLAIAKLQASSRARISRNKFTEQKKAAMILHAASRMYMNRTKYLELKGAATTVQSLSRMFLCRTDFIRKKVAVTNLQASSRACISRNKFTEQKKAAKKIQAASRMHTNRTKYLELKGAATTVQSLSRMFLCRTDFIRKKVAVTNLQASSRACISRNKFTEQKKAAKKIQAASRMHTNRTKYLELKGAATTVQSLSRMFLCRTDFIRKKVALTNLQASSRAYISRNKFTEQRKAAKKIQATSRMHTNRTKHLELRRATSTVQSLSRMFLCRRIYISHRSAAMIVQNTFRKYLHETNLKKSLSAELIQATWKRYMHRRDYTSFNALREVQEQWRSSADKNDYETLVAISKIPTTQRSSICKKNFINYLSSKIIQKGWRDYSYRKLLVASTRIQTYWRASAARRDYNAALSSSTCLQSNWRAYSTRKFFATKMLAVRHIQSSWRGFRCRKEHLASKILATHVQAKWRGHSCRKKYIASKGSAERLQTAWRAYTCRKTFIAISGGAKILQARWRSHQHRRKYMASLASAALIQNKWRSYICKKQYCRRICSVNTIQNNYRAYACRNYFIEYKAAKLIQSMVRMYPCRKKFIAYQVGYNAIITLQSTFRAWRCRMDYLTVLKSLTLLQAVARMHICRSRYSETKESQIAQRKKERRASEVRLMALAAKVAKKRAMQKQMEEDKRPKPGMLRMRMAQLEYGSKGGKEKSHSDVSKRLSFDGDQQRSEEGSSFRGNLNLQGTVTASQSVSITSSDDLSDITHASYEEIVNDLAKSGNKRPKCGVTIGQEMSTLYAEKATLLSSADNIVGGVQPLQTKVARRDVMEDQEHDPYDFISDGCIDMDETPLFKERIIVDDLLEDINDFESDSDSDDCDVYFEGEDFEWEDVPNLDHNLQVEDEEEDQDTAARHTAFKEWSIVDDLVDEVDTQLDDIPDIDDESDNDHRNAGSELSLFSAFNILKLIKSNHPLWNINSDDVTDTCIVTFYTVAAVASTLLGMAD